MDTTLVNRILHLLADIKESKELIGVRGELYKLLPVEQVEEVWTDIDPARCDVVLGDSVCFHDRADSYELEYMDLDNNILGFRITDDDYPIRRVMSFERFPQVAESQRRRIV